MFARLVWQSLVRRARRKLVALGIIALGVGAAGALFLLLVGVGDRVAQELGSYRANLVIEPLAPDGTLDESELPHIQETFWRNNVIGWAPILDVPGDPPLLGTRFDALRAISGSWRVSGRWPSAPDEALAGERLGRTIGDRVGEFRIVGVVASGGDEDQALLVDLAAAQRRAGLQGRIHRVLLSAATTPETALLDKWKLNPKSLSPEEFEMFTCTPFPTTVALGVADAFTGATGRPIRRVTDSEGRLVQKIDGVLLMLAVAALLAAVIGVVCTMNTIVLERRKEVGILKALGASDLKIVQLFLSEALVLGLLGSVLGYLLAWLLARALSGALFHWTVAGSPAVYLVTLFLAVIVASLGVLWPLRELIRVQPRQVLHEV